VNACGDSKLIVEQINGDSQCLDGTLNSYQEKCLDMVKTMDAFHIKHVPREENEEADALAQQALGREVTKGLFFVKTRLAVCPTAEDDNESAKECCSVGLGGGGA
jgi:ribonuclease HI